MNDNDFKECLYIEKNMKFITFYDFCDNRHQIKEKYKELGKNAKLFYKWYLYANIHMNEPFKNSCWDYLNGNLKDEDFIYRRRFYKIF